MRGIILIVFLGLLTLGIIGAGAYFFTRTASGDLSWPAAPLSSSTPVPFNPDATPVEPSYPTIDLNAKPVNSPDAYLPRGRDQLPPSGITETPSPSEETAF